MPPNNVFVCSNCGEEYSKWQGKCSVCNEWNTLKEFNISKKKDKGNSKIGQEIKKISDITLSANERSTTGFHEFDRVLGGGIVKGSVILLGGDPGIGKSTLLLQIADKQANVLYVSGEESAEQIKIRHDRLGLKNKNLKLLPEINLDSILLKIDQEKPSLVIIDSIQTVYSEDFPSTPGSIVQVRECALKLQQFAKEKQVSIVLVGHMTKDGTVAGPRTLEHLVDVVLYLEGERFQNTRILRTTKNRFGATDEIGVFEMKENGLVEIANPSELFLAERQKNTSGSVITSLIEGTRALLVEVQALTTTASFGYPQRKTNGFDLNRLQMLIAVLQKRISLNLANQDIFVNIVGGIRSDEPAIDLAVCLAIASAFTGKSISAKLCAFGEVGLSGEVRHVSLENKRRKEAERLGFNCFASGNNLKKIIGENLSV